MSLADAKVEVKLSDINSLQQRIRELEESERTAQKRIDDARLGGPDDVRRQYKEAFDAAYEVARFAIANLDPLTVRRWPFQRLREIADHLTTLPGVSGFDAEHVGHLRLFAQRCEEWERARALGLEHEKLAEENAARGPLQVPVVVGDSSEVDSGHEDLSS